MTAITTFTFNPFQENSYIISNDEKECWIIDPGCSNDAENERLLKHIKDNDLTPIALINTHCHIDHVLGNKFVYDQFNLLPIMHKIELEVLKSCTMVSKMYGVPYTEAPLRVEFIDEGQTLSLGSNDFELLFTPGHSPGSLCFYNAAEKYVIAGDVLFLGSIGRTDLPGGDYNTLINSIKSKLLTLPDDVVVYNGHGPKTTIGHERTNNPFL